jgi:predicted nucleotidyltransferase
MKLLLIIIFAVLILIPVNIHAEEIPKWIKTIVGWWSDGSIEDDDFLKGIQYLIKEKIITVQKTSPANAATTDGIPDWIKNNAKWWSDGLIEDDDFLKGIQNMVERGIIQVN